MGQFTAGWPRMNLRKNCAQLAQSKSWAQAGRGRPFILRKRLPLSKGSMTSTATPCSFAAGSRRASASRIASE
ncbi:hypothetical protein COSO111634_38570 [Corallococcus soli]